MGKRKERARFQYPTHANKELGFFRLTRDHISKSRSARPGMPLVQGRSIIRIHYSLIIIYFNIVGLGPSPRIAGGGTHEDIGVDDGVCLP